MNKKVLVSFAPLLLISSFVTSCNKDYSKLIVSCMGDSITYGTWYNGQLDKPYPTVLKETLNFKEVHNYGIGGSTVANGDNSHEPMVNRIKNIDSKSNVIIFYGGGNDLARDLPIGNKGNKEPNTLYGAYYNICSYIKENFKDAFTMFMTPLPAKVDGVMYYLSNVINPMKYTCELFNIPLLDLTYNSSFEEEIEAGLNDGIHPSQDYVSNKLTPKIVEFIKKNI